MNIGYTMILAYSIIWRVVTGATFPSNLITGQ
jgi:hypothetical protein